MTWLEPPPPVWRLRHEWLLDAPDAAVDRGPAWRVKLRYKDLAMDTLEVKPPAANHRAVAVPPRGDLPHC